MNVSVKKRKFACMLAMAVACMMLPHEKVYAGAENMTISGGVDRKSVV